MANAKTQRAGVSFLLALKEIEKFSVLTYSLILSVAVSAVFFMGARSPDVGANDGSRWATVDSLVHRGTYSINESEYSDTNDRVYTVDASGLRTYFSSKPAFLATWVSVIALPLDSFGVCIANYASEKAKYSRTLILFLINILPFCFCILAYSKYLQEEKFSPWAKTIALIAASWGTYYTGYLTTLNNHVQGISALLAAFFFFRRFQKEREKSKFAFLTGFLLGLAVAHEVPSVLIAVVLLYLMGKFRPRLFPYVFLIFSLPVLAYCVLDWFAVGEIPRPLSFILRMKSLPLDSHMTGFYNGKKDPRYLRVFHMTFGHHGIFSLSPVFLLTLLPLLYWKKLMKDQRRNAYFTVMAISLVAFSAFVFKISNYGGLCQGFRWLFWLIPVWLVVLPHALEVPLAGRPLFKLVTLFFLGISIFSAFSGLRTDPWYSSWFEDLVFGPPTFSQIRGDSS